MKKQNLPVTVQQSNRYVSSFFNTWTPAERRTVLALAAAMQKGDADDKQYRVDLSVVMEAADLSSSNRYSSVKSACYRLLNRKVFHEEILPDGRKKLIGANLVSEVTYLEDETAVSIEPTPAARRYFQQLKSTFTLVPVMESMRLSQFAHARLHELLLQFASTGWRRIPVEDLRPLLGLAQIDEQGKITSQKYRTTGELLKHVIQPAIKAIEENTSIQNVSVTQEKKGRRIIALRFSFHIAILPKPRASTPPTRPDVFILEAQLDPVLELDRMPAADLERLRTMVTQTGVTFLPPQIRNNPELLEQAIREMMVTELLRQRGE